MGLNSGESLGDPKDPRTCIIKSLALEVEGRKDVLIDLSAPGQLEALKDKPFTIKEGSTFRIKVVFQVHHDVLSGLKYLQVVKRRGIRVSKDEEMLVSSDFFSFCRICMGWCLIEIQGSYAPSTKDKPKYEKKCKSFILMLDTYASQHTDYPQSTPRRLPRA